MAGKVIVQSDAGEVRIEAEVVDGKTRFRTYLKNSLYKKWNLDNEPEANCTPQGVASYYVTKLQNEIESVLKAHQIEVKVTAELVADMQ
jgi:hypothetical protein